MRQEERSRREKQKEKENNEGGFRVGERKYKIKEVELGTQC